MNFIMSLPELQGYDAIFMTVDQFSKLAHMVPIVWIATALETATFFLQCMVEAP